MGLLLSLPLAGGLGTVATSCFAGIAFCFTSTAASMFFKSCNCNSSIATRVGFAIIFSLNSILAWIMKTEMVIELIRKWSYDYIKMDCVNDKCYGVLAVHRICFALTLLHTILSLSLIGVKDTRDKRAAIQNGWWGPKVLLWIVLVIVTFFIPNPFFIFWGNYVSLIGATVFILLGLVLLVDFAHTWSETCLDNWENSDGSSNLWQWILIGSTAAMYIFTITLTGLLFAYFAGPGCTLNRFFIAFNLTLTIIITVMNTILALVLAQSGMVAAYSTYLIISAVSNHTHESSQACNPLRNSESTARTTASILGAIFTFLAIAYSTTRAATQSRALIRKGKRGGAVQLPDDGLDGHAELGVVNKQPSKTDSPRYQALLAAVEAGAIPASALQEEESDDEDDEVDGETRDDERSGTRYNYSWFHVIFAIASMYVAMLLNDWNVVTDISKSPNSNNIYIGRSEVAMWMRVVSSWICMLLYIWSLLAPVLMPDRFGDL
ncbi:serine incorporator/TMS membrane protein [Mycena galericulata]|nr:serine incorporator/TMS membrane protein [Mycena galericulata]